MAGEGDILIEDQRQYGKVRKKEGTPKVTEVQKTPQVKRDKGSRNMPKKRAHEPDTFEKRGAQEPTWSYRPTKRGIETRAGEHTQQEKAARARLVRVLSQRNKQTKADLLAKLKKALLLKRAKRR